jgi:phosphoglucomutase
MIARSGLGPGELYRQLTEHFGAPAYRRIDVAASPTEKEALGRLSAEHVRATELAGEPIREVLSTAPGNGAAIGGLKVVTEHGWFAARPSGTEAVYKIYAESFRGAGHLERVLEEAQSIVQRALDEAGAPS